MKKKTTENEIGKSSTNFFVSFGMEYQYCFLKMKKYDFYALVGARTWYRDYNNSYGTDSYYSAEIYNTNSISLGIGTEQRISKYFVVNVDIGFANMWQLERKWKSEYFPRLVRIYSNTFTFAGGIGLGFVF